MTEPCRERGAVVDANRNQDMVGHFSVNLVGIAASQYVGNPPVENTFFIAGCIVTIKNEWFFVTAGHCLERLDEALQRTRVERIRLVDYAGEQSTHRFPIPFDYETTFRQYWNEPNGLDFGYVYLSAYYRRLLEANG